jgi:putative GTP pyrophosphokinase
MNEQELLAKFEAEKPIYSAWGYFISQVVLSELSTIHDLSIFLKVPPAPRLKSSKSLISKAFYRGKNYSNPYEDITDKVGLRFVVLLQKDIHDIRNIIEECNSWNYSKDRDYEEEKINKPLVFEYQSVHYIVTPKKQIVYDDITIPKSTTCEIQIRTILQHAYAELAHDTIYKPNNRIPPEVLRMVARSMALIESTNDLFSAVQSVIEEAEELIMTKYEELLDLYSEIKSPDSDLKLNLFILESLGELVTSVKIRDLKKNILPKSDIKDIVQRKYEDLLIYRQPVVLLILYLIKHKRYRLIELWPLTEDELRPLFTDMGIALNSN